MTETQVRAFFVEPTRDDYGAVLPAPLTYGPPATREQLFRRRLFLLGVRDPETVESLWADERAKNPPPPPNRRR